MADERNSWTLNDSVISSGEYSICPKKGPIVRRRCPQSGITSIRNALASSELKGPLAIYCCELLRRRVAVSQFYDNASVSYDDVWVRASNSPKNPTVGQRIEWIPTKAHESDWCDFGNVVHSIPLALRSGDVGVSPANPKLSRNGIHLWLHVATRSCDCFR